MRTVTWSNAEWLAEDSLSKYPMNNRARTQLQGFAYRSGEYERVFEIAADVDKNFAAISAANEQLPFGRRYDEGRALRNLVSNAVRYGGSAEVSVEVEGNTAVLAVDDRGPGIPAERIADMLEPFTRGEASRNRATGGAGLGLTLARAIADHHGGELILVNRNSGGLRAELRLPL